jgi:putative hydrolase of the HAD superfamily
LIQVVFFDVGATLLTPKTEEGVTFSAIASQLDITIDPAHITPLVPTMYSLYEQLYEQDDSFWSDDVRAQAIWIEMYEYMASLLGLAPELHRKLAERVYDYYFSPQAWKTYDDVIPLLDALKERGFKMGLISNWDSTLEPIIKGLGLAHYFDPIISSAVARLHKPMPEIFLLALEHIGAKPENAMHIGDHVYADAKGAAGVGITPVLLDRHGAHADYEGLRVTSLSEVGALLP